MTDLGQLETSVIAIELPRYQVRAIYDLLVAKALSVEAAEEAMQTGMGSLRYREAADALWEALHA